jgi:SAM-dependent methyltransferase
MVHALGEIHRVLAPGGVLVDARPDSRLPAYAEREKPRGFEPLGVVDTAKLEKTNDLAADAAIERVLQDRLFATRRKGRFWHRVPFDDLAALRRYLWDHQRFVRRARWLVDQATLRRHANDRFVIRRAVRYQVLERISR